MTHWAHGWWTAEWQLAYPQGSTCLSKYIVSVSVIISKMLSPCAYVPCKVWSDIFIVNKLLVWWVTCFVRWLCIIVFNDFLGTQACQTNLLHVCFCLQPSLFVLSRSLWNIHNLLCHQHPRNLQKNVSLLSQRPRIANPGQCGHQASAMA